MGNRSGLSKAMLWTAAGAGLLLFARAQAIRFYPFRGKIALITGGSRGLGLLLARHLVAAGASVVICARDEEELDRARQDLQMRGGDVFAMACDLRHRDDVEAWLTRVLQYYGPSMY